MSDPDLRPEQRAARPRSRSVYSGPAWWEPLATKSGLIGIAIFIGLAFGAWEAATNAFGPAAPVKEARERPRNVTEERAACDKIPDRVLRQTCGLRSIWRSRFAERAAKGTRDFAELELMQKELQWFYRDLANYSAKRVSLEEDDQIKEELRGIEIMPYESGAAMVLRYVGRASEDTIKEALPKLNVERALRKPSQLDTFEGPPHLRPPLFPDLPRPRETPDRVKEKWDLNDAIRAIYRDCEEHFRPLYTKHLNVLFREYVSKAARVDRPPPEKTYPLFLLEKGAMPNEQLAGALSILWADELTPRAQQLVLETPEAIFAKGCPSDRSAMRAFGGNISPERSGELVRVNGPPLSPEEMRRVPVMPRLASDTCTPLTRYMFPNYMRLLVTKWLVATPRRPLLPPDVRLLERLKSADRKAVLEAVEEILAAAAISEDLAARLPEAAASAFHDLCPNGTAETQLEEFRQEKKRLDERILAVLRESEARRK